MLGASAQIMAPYSAADVQVRVSQVAVDSGGAATISRSQSTPNWTGRPTGQPVTLPSNIATPGVYYIWGEVQYAYAPTIGYIWIGTHNLQDQTFMAPRIAVAGIPTPQ